MITFSGIDSAGKSTQITLVEDYYKKQNKRYKVIWGRGGWTPGIELLKKILRRSRRDTNKQETDDIIPNHKKSIKRKIFLFGSILDLFLYFGIYYRWSGLFGREVVCDRYIWDTYIDFFVDYKDIPFEEWFVWKVLLKVIPYPRNSIIFTISPEESIRRDMLKDEKFMETKEVKTIKINKYYELIGQNKWTNQIDGNESIDEIFHKVEILL